jgi:LacI family transcriptional regulator
MDQKHSSLVEVPHRIPGRVTLADVARLCDVTPATVSRVLNRQKKFSTSDAVRERIHATAEKLGYVPDLAARNFRRRETHIVGVFANPLAHVTEGINESLLEGVAEVLHTAGYDVFFDLRSSPNATFPNWRFDAAILLQQPRTEIIAELDRRRVPYVCVNEQASGAAANVLADDRMGMERALQHLFQLGHKKIAYANARSAHAHHYSVSERYEALLSGAAARGMAVSPDHDMPMTSPSKFLRTVIREGGATAVVTYDHQLAVMLVGAAQEMHLRIPGDFSLICFNDVFPVALLPPPLTAVAVSGRAMGRQGAELLLNRLISPAAGPDAMPREVRVPEDLVVRASTAPPPPLR